MDPVWEYAKKIKPNKFQCKFCRDTFYGCTKRIKIHLAQLQRRHIRQCPNVPPEVRDKCLHYLLESSSRSCSGQASMVETETEETEPRREIVAPENEERLQSESVNVDVDVDDGVLLKVRESIYRFFKSNGLPMETVENATFVDMFCSITHFGSKGVPTSKDLYDLKGFIIDEDDDDDDDIDWD